MNIFKRYKEHLKKVWSKPSEGFGDTFAKITKSFGIKPCGGCDRRRKTWNEKLAYAKKKKAEKEQEEKGSNS